MTKLFNPTLRRETKLLDQTHITLFKPKEGQQLILIKGKLGQFKLLWSCSQVSTKDNKSCQRNSWTEKRSKEAGGLLDTTGLAGALGARTSHAPSLREGAKQRTPAAALEGDEVPLGETSPGDIRSPGGGSTSPRELEVRSTKRLGHWKELWISHKPKVYTIWPLFQKPHAKEGARQMHAGTADHGGDIETQKIPPRANANTDHSQQDIFDRKHFVYLKKTNKIEDLDLLRISSKDIQDTTGSTLIQGTDSVTGEPLTEMQVAPEGIPPREAPAPQGKVGSTDPGEPVGTEEDSSYVSTFQGSKAVPIKQRITQDQHQMITQGRLPRMVLDNSIQKKFAKTGMPSSERDGALTPTNSLNKTTTQAQRQRRPDRVGIVQREELEKHAHEKFKEILVGVSQGYTMNLELKGIGYQVRREGWEKPTQRVKTSTVSPLGDGYPRGVIPSILSGQASQVLGLQHTGPGKAGGKPSQRIENPRYIGFLELLAYSQGTLPKVSGQAAGIQDTHGSYLWDGQSLLQPAPAALAQGGLPHPLSLDGFNAKNIHAGTLTQGDKLWFNIGFNHEILHTIPEQTVSIKLIPTPGGPTSSAPSEDVGNIGTSLSIFGISKAKVHQTAAEIYAYKKPEAYKGKGIRYDGEKFYQKKRIKKK